MKKNHKLVFSFLVLSCLTYVTGGEIVQPAKPILSVMQMPEDKDKQDFFVFASGGGSFFSEEEKGTSFIKGALDDKSAVFEVGLGYYFTKNIFTELAYQRSMLDIANVDSGYLSLNYQFSNTMLNPYIGIVGGYSRLKWSKRPHIMRISEDLTSASSLYGVQAGLKLPITDNFSLTVKYQYMKLDHLMNIRSGASSIKHNNVQNLLLGVKYEF